LLNTVLGSFSSGVVAATSSYESIATINPTSGTSVTFSSIPGTYKHLQIRSMLNNTAYTQLVMTFNSDSGSNYARHLLSGNGTTVTATGGATQNQINNAAIAGASTSLGVTIIDIIDYASTTKYKTTRSFNGMDANGSGRVELGSGLWQSTSAITSITLTDPNYSFSSGTLALYGIKG
jgi:hypothetical protein